MCAHARTHACVPASMPACLTASLCGLGVLRVLVLVLVRACNVYVLWRFVIHARKPGKPSLVPALAKSPPPRRGRNQSAHTWAEHPRATKEHASLNVCPYLENMQSGGWPQGLTCRQKWHSLTRSSSREARIWLPTFF